MRSAITTAMLDKELQKYLMLTHGFGYRKVEELSVMQMRKNVRQLASMTALPRMEAASVFDLTVPGGEGSSIPLRVYRPDKGSEMLPGLVYFHGGGFVLYDIDDFDGWCSYLAMTAGIAVVSVGYRLAPECRFPAAHEDADAVLKHIGEHASHLFIDPRRLAVGGDSAGGNLAASAALRSAVHNIRVVFQLLIYPALTFGKDFSSYEQYGRGFWLDATTMEWFQSQFLDPDRADKDDSRLHPLFTDRPGDAPPAILAIAEYDILRDEAMAYHHRLKEHGVDSQLLYFDELGHNFLLMAGRIKAAKKALSMIAGEVRRHFYQTNTIRI